MPWLIQLKSRPHRDTLNALQQAILDEPIAGVSYGRPASGGSVGGSSGSANVQGKITLTIDPEY